MLKLVRKGTQPWHGVTRFCKNTPGACLSHDGDPGSLTSGVSGCDSFLSTFSVFDTFPTGAHVSFIIEAHDVECKEPWAPQSNPGFLAGWRAFGFSVCPFILAPRGACVLPTTWSSAEPAHSRQQSTFRLFTPSCLGSWASPPQDFVVPSATPLSEDTVAQLAPPSQP